MNNAGTDAIDPEMTVGMVERHAAGERHDTGLGSAIGRQPGAGDQAHQRGVVDDRGLAGATGAVQQGRQRGARHQVGAAQIDRHHLIPDLRRCLRHRAEDLDPGIVDQDVEAAQRRQRRRQAGFDAGGRAQIDRQRHARPAGQRQRLAGAGEIDVDGGDAGALGGQPQRGGPADARRRPSDEAGPADEAPRLGTAVADGR